MTSFRSWIRPQTLSALTGMATIGVSSQVLYSQAEASNNTSTNEGEALFQGQCLQRQLFQPRVPYPAWDYNWDGRMTDATSLQGVRRDLDLQVRGKTRHIILVRHGQYDESSKLDELRKLTPLGRYQAILTGRRLRELMEGCNHFEKEEFRGPCKIKSIVVSDLRRAKETAELIAQELDMNVSTPDPDLNEALAAPIIPVRPDISGVVEEVDQHQGRIERAFRRYFWRDNSRRAPVDDEDVEESHEFVIIVCHGNIIRYLLCRALQLPPEAWLRFSTFNCSLTYLMIRPTGNVSCRMVGDVGHLKYDESTFSGSYGFRW
eukprot:Nitzschia sp. Nitz4//scaffold159_size51929//17441//18498//NITZ4_006874-RA/size51929-augustus-gene-0.79-mRNA-1//-1//CDS//3329537559//3868//frame0